MGIIISNDLVINVCRYENNDSITRAEIRRATYVGEAAFKDCVQLECVVFGRNIEKICFGAFDGCESLKDVWFNVIDENKIISIDEGAFRNCKPDITFHINASAINNVSLNQYAKTHGFRVERRA